MFKTPPKANKSPTKPSTNDKETKKRQSRLKQIVQTFGSLIVSWIHSNEQIYQLVDNVIQVSNTRGSITRTKDSIFFQTMTEKNSLINWNLINEKINALILEDTESLFRQIRIFENKISDIHAAMIQCSDEAQNMSINQDPDFLGINYIFSTDHILDIIDIHKMFNLEWERRKKLLNTYIWTISDINIEKGTSEHYEECLKAWRLSPVDDVNLVLFGNEQKNLGYIDKERVDSFILKNNIKQISG